ncbi:MAG: hypothetical protein JXB48_22720 [Candidatus Latescibacteria bacterium]|nr:hypothetical protein [Candidatus Latescibacterota bacterium]
MNIYSESIPVYLYEFIEIILKKHTPHTALMHFENYLKTTGASLDNYAGKTEFFTILASVFSKSSALSGRLISNPSFIETLATFDQPYAYRPEKDFYLDHIRSFYEKKNITTEKIKSIHLLHNVHLMRICARNSDPHIPISEISYELSSLAEAVIELCLEIAVNELFTRIGIPPQSHSLVVLGLGKLGGRELNVSSDIDLIYLCTDTDKTWGNYDSITFHTMLAERLTRILTEPTALGSMYRVDTRLRADGTSGPLVRTGKDYFRYLELRGEGWERQMLLKARPVAGDYSVAGNFLRSVESFIFPTSITRSPNREIVALKNQIEARLITDGSKKTHLKLMQGGIRDIEFIAQCLQLLMGGTHPEVRTTNTLQALDLLRGNNALSEKEFVTLLESYTFYRRIENALQWKELLPVFSIPSDEETLDSLAKSVGIENAEVNPGMKLKQQIALNMKQVRAIYNEIFDAESSGSIEEMSVFTAVAPPGDEKVRRFLENLGFTNPDESARLITDLAFEHIHGATETILHPSAERFLPVLLQALGNLPDPGGALERFKRVTESYKARYILFDILLSNSTFFDLIISVTYGSVYITDILSSDPSLLDWLFEMAEILHPLNKKELHKELSRIDKEMKEDQSFIHSCLITKNREKLRIGARDITELSNTLSSLKELTDVAESIVKTVYDRSFRKISALSPFLRNDYEFCIIAAGRLGAEIMNFGSDLDLIFVYNPGSRNKSNIEIPECSVKLAHNILFLLTGGGGPYKIYDVDARLRPEGGNSVLAISLEEYEKYLHKRASEWERLALLRARYIAGNKSLGSETISILNSFIYRKPFTHEEVERIINIRSAMVDSSLKRYPGLTNIKSGPGGISDIDFIAQVYSAHFGSENNNIRGRETTALLNILAKEKVIGQHTVSTLTELYTFLTDVEKVLRISSGKAVNTLPVSGPELTRISGMLGFKNIRRFNNRLDNVLSLTREHYERMMKELCDQAKNA